MKMLINSEEDLKKLQGKFILQINSKEPNKQLMDFRWDFVKEKRLYIVVGRTFVDLYGNQTKEKSFEEFKNFFNSYLFNHMIDEGKTDGGRFHRLLTNKELDYLIQKIKEENYE